MSYTDIYSLNESTHVLNIEMSAGSTVKHKPIATLAPATFRSSERAYLCVLGFRDSIQRFLRIREGIVSPLNIVQGFYREFLRTREGRESITAECCAVILCRSFELGKVHEVSLLNGVDMNFRVSSLNLVNMLSG